LLDSMTVGMSMGLASESAIATDWLRVSR